MLVSLFTHDIGIRHMTDLLTKPPDHLHHPRCALRGSRLPDQAKCSPHQRQLNCSRSVVCQRVSPPFLRETKLFPSQTKLTTPSLPQRTPNLPNQSPNETTRLPRTRPRQQTSNRTSNPRPPRKSRCSPNRLPPPRSWQRNNGQHDRPRRHNSLPAPRPTRSLQNKPRCLFRQFRRRAQPIPHRFGDGY